MMRYVLCLIDPKKLPDDLKQQKKKVGDAF